MNGSAVSLIFKCTFFANKCTMTANNKIKNWVTNVEVPELNTDEEKKDCKLVYVYLRSTGIKLIQFDFSTNYDY